MYLTSVVIAGVSIGLHFDHSHYCVLCNHIYGWHSQHGHLVLLDKGKQRLQLYQEKIKCMLLTFIFFFFYSSCTK